LLPLTTDATVPPLHEPRAESPARVLGRRLITAEWLPWALTPLLLMGFWVFEAWLHSQVFGHNRLVLSLLRPDGHELWMRIVVAGMLVVVAVLWAGAVHERNARIREMELYQDRLRELSAWMSFDEGEERRGLSERLHEHVAQTLSAARMYLSSVEAADEGSRADLASAQRILDEAIADCREVAHELSPPVLDAYGLLSALEAIALRVASRAAARVEVVVGDDVPLERAVLHASYRVITDVMESAASDPKTSSVRVSAHSSGSGLEVVVEWDSPSNDDLFGASEIMAHVGGGVERRVSEHGTSVVVTAPIAA